MPKLIDALINPRQIHQVFRAAVVVPTRPFRLSGPELDTPQQLNRQPNIARPTFIFIGLTTSVVAPFTAFFPSTPSFAILVGRAPRPPFLPRSLAPLPPPPPCLRAGRKHCTGQRSPTVAERSAAWKLYDRHHLTKTKALFLIPIGEGASRRIIACLHYGSAGSAAPHQQEQLHGELQWRQQHNRRRRRRRLRLPQQDGFTPSTCRDRGGQPEEELAELQPGDEGKCPSPPDPIVPASSGMR